MANSGDRLDHSLERAGRAAKEADEAKSRRHQPGIGYPSAGAQRHLLVVRIDLAPPPPQPGAPPFPDQVRAGLARLGRLLERIARGEKTIEVLGDGGLSSRPLADYRFSATVGFGAGFFGALATDSAKRPRGLRAMPDATALGDQAPYSLGQTDLLVQLGSSDDFVNRWVLDSSPPPPPSGQPEDIASCLTGWATVTDVHAGFQRTDGRNLHGFNDGVSNPRRLTPLFDQVVWTTAEGEPAALAGGTYLVFQKIVHDLDQWSTLDDDEQSEWVGRSKGTGLLLGTLSAGDDAKLAADLGSSDPAVRDPARARWKALFDPQSDPQTPFFDHAGGDPDGAPTYGRIPLACPAWSHVRKANPRREDGRIDEHLIFRRGYPFREPGPDGRERTGLLFVCFQRDLAAGFEHLKRRFFGEGGFPVPSLRPFNRAERDARHRHGRFAAAELQALDASQRALLGLADPADLQAALAEAAEPQTQQTGREGLAGPSEHGVTPTGELSAIVPLGGGYYFVPPLAGSWDTLGSQFF